jgi:NADP-dependent 3-hydroxy acid dehydrogenase YdfG
MARLENKAAVIVGGSGGIGGAIARELAAEGVRVCLVGRDRQRLDRMAETIGVRTTVCPADVGDDDSVRAAATQIVERLGRVDILVFAHGNYVRSRIDESSVEDLDRLYAANIRGPYLLTKLLLPELRAAQGEIVFINSSQGLKATYGVGQYAATQHALKGFADNLRNEINADGVRVLNVFSGRSATPLQERIFAEERRPYAPELLIQPEDIAAVVVASLKIGRSAEITDIRIRPMRPLDANSAAHAAQDRTATSGGGRAPRPVAQPIAR